MTRAQNDCVWLRILATSDVHAHLRSFDYSRNKKVSDWGLTRLATRISEAREEAPLFILFDNAVQKSGFCHLEGLQNLLSYKNTFKFMNLRINVPDIRTA